MRSIHVLRAIKLVSIRPFKQNELVAWSTQLYVIVPLRLFLPLSTSTIGGLRAQISSFARSNACSQKNSCSWLGSSRSILRCDCWYGHNKKTWAFILFNLHTSFFLLRTAQRGHKVVLFEKDSEIGGQVNRYIFFGY